MAIGLFILTVTASICQHQVSHYILWCLSPSNSLVISSSGVPCLQEFSLEPL